MAPGFARIRGRLAAGLAALTLACVSPPPPAPQVPAWQDRSAAIVVEDDERELWQESEQAIDTLRSEGALFEDAALLAYLDGVLEALVPDGLPAEMPRPSVSVLRSIDRNASAFADGRILVSTSFLAALADEAQAAATLGHELAHFLARHPLSDLRSQRQSASTVTRMTWSRAREDEADRLGLELMERAGYDPRAMPEMLALLGAEENASSRPERAFASHPFTGERVRTLESRVALVSTARGRRDAARFEQAIADLLLVDARLELEAGRLDRAGTVIERRLRLRPADGRSWYWKAELERRVAKEGRRAPAARAAYERAVELAPGDAEALRALAFLYREEGEVDGARVLFRRYLDAAPVAPDRKLIERYLAEMAP